MRIPPHANYLLVSSLSLALLACSEREDPLRNFGLVPDIVDSTAIRSLVVPVSDLDTFFQTTRNGGSRMWVGFDAEAAEATEAKILLRFEENVIPQGAVILADTLQLFCDLRGDYGDEVLQTISVQRITSDSWFTDQTQGWPFDDHQPLSPSVSFGVAACVDTPTTRVSVVLPPGLVASWVAAPDSNLGIALVASGGGGFKRFVATGSSAPTIGVLYQTGSTDSTRVRLTATDHATLTRLSNAVADSSGGEPVALVAGAFDFRAVLRFDLSAVPIEASINRLRLTLSLDPGSTFLGEDSTRVAIGVHEIIDLPGEILGPRPVVGFATTPLARAQVDPATDTAVTLAITPLARVIERGILIKVDRDFPALVRFGFVTREGAPALHPRLEVTYSLPAKIRL